MQDADGDLLGLDRRAHHCPLHGQRQSAAAHDQGDVGIVLREAAVLGSLVLVVHVADPDVTRLEGDDDIRGGAIRRRIAQARVHQVLAEEDLVDDLAGRQCLRHSLEVDSDRAGLLELLQGGHGLASRGLVLQPDQGDVVLSSLCDRGARFTQQVRQRAVIHQPCQAHARVLPVLGQDVQLGRVPDAGLVQGIHNLADALVGVLHGAFQQRRRAPSWPSGSRAMPPCASFCATLTAWKFLTLPDCRY